MGLLRKNKPAAQPAAAAPQTPQVDFRPKAATKDEAQGLMIAARQIPGFEVAVGLVSRAMTVRADQILMDFTAQGAAVRFRVDGVWEAMPPMEREIADGSLASLKKLCGLNVADRRSRQSAKLPVYFKKSDWIIDFVSQGVANGERVLMRIDPKKPLLKTLADLGMRDKMADELRSYLNATGGLVVISGPPGHGLPTMWRVSLEAADKFVKDYISIEDSVNKEDEVINVTANYYNSAAGENPMTVLPSLALKQPDVYVVPELTNDETVKMLMHEMKVENRHAITKTVANDAVEALLKLLSKHRGVAKEMLGFITCVTSQRLIRRLCDSCRQPFAPNPQLLQKLGLPPDRVKTLYQPFMPPPVEERVDAKGNPIEIEICKKCEGRGYYGRMAIYEILKVDDHLRKAVLQKPDADTIRQYAKKLGHRNLQDDFALAIALGQTSIQELQRVLYGK